MLLLLATALPPQLSEALITSGYQSYYSAMPAPDAVDEATGTLTWSDLTGVGQLDPSASILIHISFTALDETGTTVDNATVKDASASEFGTVSGGDTLQVDIEQPVGGEVLLPDTDAYKAAIATMLLALAATVLLRRRR